MSKRFGQAPPKMTRDSLPNPLVNRYLTKDGRLVQLVMLQGVRFWPELITAVGRPDLATDERFTSPEMSFANREEGTRILDEISATRTYDEWKDVLAEVKGVWAPVQTGLDLHDDVHVQANGYLGDAVSVQGAPFQLVTTRRSSTRSAPRSPGRPSSASTPSSTWASTSASAKSEDSRESNHESGPPARETPTATGGVT